VALTYSLILCEYLSMPNRTKKKNVRRTVIGSPKGKSAGGV